MATDSLDPAGIYFGTNKCPSQTISLRFLDYRRDWSPSKFPKTGSIASTNFENAFKVLL